MADTGNDIFCCEHAKATEIQAKSPAIQHFIQWSRNPTPKLGWDKSASMLADITYVIVLQRARVNRPSLRYFIPKNSSKEFLELPKWVVPRWIYLERLFVEKCSWEFKVECLEHDERFKLQLVQKIPVWEIGTEPGARRNAIDSAMYGSWEDQDTEAASSPPSHPSDCTSASSDSSPSQSRPTSPQTCNCDCHVDKAAPPTSPEIYDLLAIYDISSTMTSIVLPILSGNYRSDLLSLVTFDIFTAKTTILTTTEVSWYKVLTPPKITTFIFQCGNGYSLPTSHVYPEYVAELAEDALSVVPYRLWDRRYLVELLKYMMVKTEADFLREGELDGMMIAALDVVGNGLMEGFRVDLVDRPRRVVGR